MHTVTAVVIGIVAGAVSVAARVSEMMVWMVESEVPVRVTKEAVTAVVLICSVAEDSGTGLPGMAVTVVAKPPAGVLIELAVARMVVGAGVL